MLRGLAFFLLVLCGPAVADDGLTPQQKRMQHCNGAADAKKLSGPGRNHYMVECLKGKDNGNGRKLSPQQQRSEDCSHAARARHLQGAERRGFVNSCSKPEADRRPVDCAKRADKMDMEAEDRFRFINGCVEGTKRRT